MFSSSCKALFPIFVYLSLLVAVVDCHDAPLHARDHVVMNKRIMKKRSPFPADIIDIRPPVAGAAGIPSLPASDSASVAATSVVTSGSASASASQSVTSASASVTDSVSASASASVSASASASSASESVSASASVTPASVQITPAAPHETLNVADAPVTPSVSTVIPTITRIESVDASETAKTGPISGAAISDSTPSKGTTWTIVIAIAASIGGVAILWTIFRKWKLSSSKKFDQRLNPIDWQPTADDGVPTHRRVPSGSSYHSGSGNSTSRTDPLDHDFTAGVSPVGGYADMARGPSPTMQENITRGPSFNQGYNNKAATGYGTRY